MLLKKGSTGDDVKKLQEKLGLGADGTFGSGTEAAVKKWQSDNGLTADGIVGEGTWSKMFGSVVTETAPIVSGGSLDLNKLKGKIPQSIFDILPEAFEKYSINTPLRASHFLGQIAHESGDFTIKTESMNYSTPSRIVDIWPSRFNLDGSGSKKDANKYIKNQELLAEAVYGGRMGNNDAGDGFRFRGGGFLQLTGKEAYQGYAKYLGKTVGETADLLRSENKYAMDAACWEYVVNMKLNTVADQGMNDDVIKVISKKINGGYIGLDDRKLKCKKYYSILS
jgi:putative chitinase